MKNVVTWFEIPTVNLDRAVKFYETVLGLRAKVETFNGVQHAMFLGDKEGASGALIFDPRRKPSTEGTVVYLNANKDIDGALDRAKRAGGRVVLPKTDIGEPGFIAILADTEGNHVALHDEK
jgi:predicted enzyme related to lactoylglutathione lyase